MLTKKEKKEGGLDVSSNAKSYKEGHFKFYWLVNSSCLNLKCIFPMQWHSLKMFFIWIWR